MPCIFFDACGRIAQLFVRHEVLSIHRQHAFYSSSTASLFAYNDHVGFLYICQLDDREKGGGVEFRVR